MAKRIGQLFFQPLGILILRSDCLFGTVPVIFDSFMHFCFSLPPISQEALRGAPASTSMIFFPLTSQFQSQSKPSVYACFVFYSPDRFPPSSSVVRSSIPRSFHLRNGTWFFWVGFPFLGHFLFVEDSSSPLFSCVGSFFRPASFFFFSL